MKFLSAIIFLFSCALFAFNNGPIPPKVMKKAERKYGGAVVKRFLDYNKMLNKAEHLNLERKLRLVNEFFNTISYQDDQHNWKQEDYWATPLEFLSRNKGDSEDYVIAKYFALKTLGIDPKKLYFTYVNAQGVQQSHMVLAYFHTPDADPLILDNLTEEVIEASQREDLTPVYNFNANTLKSIPKTHQSTFTKWEKLNKRVTRNKL